MVARMDPLGLPRSSPPELDPSFYGLRESDFDQKISPDSLSGCKVETPPSGFGPPARNLHPVDRSAIHAHIDDQTEREWLQKRMEGSGNRLQLSQGRQLQILTKLTDAVIFEEFIQKKFVGAKSFSLEGCESLIPLLDLAIERAGDHGISTIVIGMAHPRAPQRSGERDEQEPAADLPRVRRCGPALARRSRRREVPPRVFQRVEDLDGAQRPSIALL